ncbi:MAG: regulatory protein RecX [Deltaproteobacteria bacterium]|nr:regulatory protein RecX [Deltaproteobacteria bacterium]
MRTLAARDRSATEVRRRLEGCGTDAVAVEATLRRLRDLGYLNDERFAATYAEAAARKGHGSERVRAELEQRDVDASITERAIAAAFADECELAERALKRQHKTLPTTAAERAKAARFLLGRGFPEAVVLAIIGQGC